MEKHFETPATMDNLGKAVTYIDDRPACVLLHGKDDDQSGFKGFKRCFCMDTGKLSRMHPHARCKSDFVINCGKSKSV